MTNVDLIQAMRLMILARNWAGYLHFRRQLVAKCDRPSQHIRELLQSLPEDNLKAYAAYFGASNELPKKFRNARIKENLLAKNNEESRPTNIKTSTRTAQRLIRR